MCRTKVEGFDGFIGDFRANVVTSYGEDFVFRLVWSTDYCGRSIDDTGMCPGQLKHFKCGNIDDFCFLSNRIHKFAKAFWKNEQGFEMTSGPAANTTMERMVGSASKLIRYC